MLDNLHLIWTLRQAGEDECNHIYDFWAFIGNALFVSLKDNLIHWHFSPPVTVTTLRIHNVPIICFSVTQKCVTFSMIFIF